MARMARFTLPGYTQHVIQRGNNRTDIFVRRDDYLFYKDCLRLACGKCDCLLHAYVLMENHVHLLMTPGADYAVSRVMQSLGRTYVTYFNRQYGRTGTLWEGRFRASLIDADRYLIPCQYYIEYNPVRSGIARTPAEYPWSSYHHHAYGVPDKLLTRHRAYLSLGASKKERCAVYQAASGECLYSKDIDAIRNATNRAWVLGDAEFKQHIEQLTSRQAGPKPRGGYRGYRVKADH